MTNASTKHSDEKCSILSGFTTPSKRWSQSMPGSGNITRSDLITHWVWGHPTPKPYSIKPKQVVLRGGPRQNWLRNQTLREKQAMSCAFLTRVTQSPFCIFSLNYDGLMLPVIPGVLLKSRQETPPIYKFNKAFYVANETWLKKMKLLQLSLW